MIRGVQRKIIVIKGDKSSVFENVYFLLRNDISDANRSDGDILREANKIIAQNYSDKKRKKYEKRKKIRRGLAIFLSGLLLGALSMVSVWILYYFV